MKYMDPWRQVCVSLARHADILIRPTSVATTSLGFQNGKKSHDRTAV